MLKKLKFLSLFLTLKVSSWFSPNQRPFKKYILGFRLVRRHLIKGEDVSLSMSLQVNIQQISDQSEHALCLNLSKSCYNSLQFCNQLTGGQCYTYRGESSSRYKRPWRYFDFCCMVMKACRQIENFTECHQCIPDHLKKAGKLVTKS